MLSSSLGQKSVYGTVVPAQGRLDITVQNGLKWHLAMSSHTLIIIYGSISTSSDKALPHLVVGETAWHSSRYPCICLPLNILKKRSSARVGMSCKQEACCCCCFLQLSTPSMNQGRCPGRVIWTSPSPTVSSPNVLLSCWGESHTTCFLLAPDKKSHSHTSHTHTHIHTDQSSALGR